LEISALAKLQTAKSVAGVAIVILEKELKLIEKGANGGRRPPPYWGQQ